MDETALLTSIALFTLLAGFCSIVFNKAKLPPLIGYLTAGIVISNVVDVSETGMTAVELLSDFGLVLLMFCIGLEINLKKIKKQGKFAVLVAVVQLPLMVVGGIIAGSVMGFNQVQSIALGAIISGSSTAVVMAVLKSQNKLNRDHIEMLVLITIMEDIGQVIILSMLTPVLAGSSMEASDLIVLITTIALFMAAVATLSCHPILHLISTPPDIYDDAYTFLVLQLLTIPMIMAYNLLASLLRALGNSRWPFYFLVMASMLNIVLSLILIVGIGMGVAGVGLATMAAQTAAAATCWLYIRRQARLLIPTGSEWRHDSRQARH
ncbi:MAG: cation:proton antiporter, partial [Candidatus Methanomethylophilaceae archaeon]|nr:cation:proton antiporter [Candidatus Methanomethylophilaceae archaeon]